MKVDEAVGRAARAPGRASRLEHRYPRPSPDNYLVATLPAVAVRMAGRADVAASRIAPNLSTISRPFLQR